MLAPMESGLFGLLPPWSLLGVFVSASLLLAVIPGPVVLYVVARSLTQGRRAGLLSVAGAACGALVNGVAAGVGLAALFATSALAYALFKYAGAAYLLYLGVKTLRGRNDEAAEAAVAQALGRHGASSVPLWPLFRDGFLVALFNPKTIIFFSAFLPQFMTVHGAGGRAAAQAVTLSTLFVLIASLSDAAYALAAGSIAPWLARHRGAGTAGRAVAGCSFLGLGLFAALSGRQP
ncbi:MAG: LysE family translocator [Burkholderiales bacterium]|nr:LysE family translocator [Burkholderiales bacterium]